MQRHFAIDLPLARRFGRTFPFDSCAVRPRLVAPRLPTGRFGGGRRSQTETPAGVGNVLAGVARRAFFAVFRIPRARPYRMRSASGGPAPNPDGENFPNRRLPSIMGPGFSRCRALPLEVIACNVSWTCPALPALPSRRAAGVDGSAPIRGGFGWPVPGWRSPPGLRWPG